MSLAAVQSSLLVQELEQLLAQAQPVYTLSQSVSLRWR
jgi:hypothetical protein